MSLQAWNLVPQAVTKTAAWESSDVDNAGYDGVIVLIDVTAVDTADADETYTFKVQGKDDLSGKYYDILSSGDVAGDGATLHTLEVHPALTEVANEKASNLLPDHIRVVLETGGTSPSISFTVRIVWM